MTRQSAFKLLARRLLLPSFKLGVEGIDPHLCLGHSGEAVVGVGAVVGLSLIHI